MTIGTAIVSYIEPHPGQVVAFNRWYESDHFPSAVLAGPGIIAGSRFVATRQCKSLRPPGATLLGDPRRGSYLAVAWVRPGEQDAWNAWVVDEMKTITAEGRLFEGREHIHTAVYRRLAVIGDRGRLAGDGVAGVIAVADRELQLPDFDAPLTVRLELEHTLISSAEPPSHELVLAFVDRDPLAVFRETAVPPEIGFASPFVATVPGTDMYTEEL